MFDRENFEKFDKSRLYRQIFPISTLHLIKAPLLIIFTAHARVHTVLILVTKPGCLYYILKYFKPIVCKDQHTKRYYT